MLLWNRSHTFQISQSALVWDIPCFIEDIQYWLDIHMGEKRIPHQDTCLNRSEYQRRKNQGLSTSQPLERLPKGRKTHGILYSLVCNIRATEAPGGRNTFPHPTPTSTPAQVQQKIFRLSRDRISDNMQGISGEHSNKQTTTVRAFARSKLVNAITSM